jgi:hypothetical protein
MLVQRPPIARVNIHTSYDLLGSQPLPPIRLNRLARESEQKAALNEEAMTPSDLMTVSIAHHHNEVAQVLKV